MQCQRKRKTARKVTYIMKCIITYNDFNYGIPYDYLAEHELYAQDIGRVLNVDDHDHWYYENTGLLCLVKDCIDENCNPLKIVIFESDEYQKIDYQKLVGKKVIADNGLFYCPLALEIPTYCVNNLRKAEN